jgi:GR25 family glycosyltransferase involved in LPS biosynthesis
MKASVIALYDLPESMEAATSATQSAIEHGLDASLFRAIPADYARNSMAWAGLTLAYYDTRFSRVEATIGCFMSHFALWGEVVAAGEPRVILEHDALVMAPVPVYFSGHIVNLGRPSYGLWRRQAEPGEYPLFSKKGEHFPGTHAYYVTPHGAAALIAKAKEVGVMPADLFISAERFPGALTEVYPWPIKSADTFTTVQLKRGCLAKRAYGSKYKIL